MFRHQFLTVAVLAVCATCTSTANSQAGFTITLFDGTSSRTIEDGGGGDYSGNRGEILITETLGWFTINASLATSNSRTNSSPAVLTIDTLQINALTWSGEHMQSLVITIEDTGFYAPGTGPARMDSVLAGSASFPGGTFTYESYLDDYPGEQGALTLNATPWGASTSKSESVTIGQTPYTLKSVLTINMSPLGIASVHGSTTVSDDPATYAAPAPSSLVLAATAIPFLGLLRRLRRTALPTSPSA